jgi:hypothetical protein
VANDTVTFSGGTTGTVTRALATQLTVGNLSGLTTGPLIATVTVNGVSSGGPVQVAAIAPVVTSSTARLPANTTSLTIQGVGFSTTAAGNTVAFSGGATGTVTAATPTQLTVTGISGLVAGSLSATVTTNGVTSGSPVQVATVAPVVTSSTARLAATATTLILQGFGFSTTAAYNTIALSGGAVGWVTAATPTQLTVNVTSLVAGPLTASVTSNSVSSGSAVQVATVAPVVTASTTKVSASTTYLIIQGFGFSSIAANDTVTFSGGATGTIAVTLGTELIVTNLEGLVTGPLTVLVTSNGVSSGSPVQVATIA